MKKYFRNLNYPLYTHSYAFPWTRCVINGKVRVIFNHKKTPVYDWVVIPDIHLRIHNLKKLLKCIPPTQRLIFAGDYFDGFDSSRKKVIKMCDFIGERIKDTQHFTFLLGNHDAHYLVPDESIRSSGYSRAHHKLIHHHLLKKYEVTVQDFKLAVIPTDGWIVSHGGVLDKHLKPFMSIEENIDNINSSLENPFNNAYLAIGKSRGGKAKVPGITWCDWNEDFKPIEMLNQVVGHTFATEKRDRIKTGYLSANYNIDTGTTTAFAYIKGGIRIIKA